MAKDVWSQLGVRGSHEAHDAPVVLLLELTHRVDGLMVPMLLAVVEATVVSRLLRGRSIYSARLSAGSVDLHTPV